MNVSNAMRERIRQAVHDCLYDTRMRVVPMFGRDTQLHSKVDFEIAQTEHAIVERVLDSKGTLKGE